MDNINIPKIIDEVIGEMQNGRVDADVILFMKMHTTYSSHFEITPVLNIKNKELLYSLIIEYIYLFKNASRLLNADSKEDYIKRLIALLFADMSIDDFNEPCLYVQRRINFINEHLLESKSIDFPLLDGKIDISIEPYGKETPHCFSPTIVGEYNSYILPIISYGISEDVCYIYAIQDYNKHEKIPYHNKIKRALYKVNDGVLDSKEYYDYKEGKSDYYPENITDVPPSFICL